MNRLAVLYFKTGILLGCIILISCNRTLKDSDQGFNLKKIAASNAGICKIEEGQGLNGPVLKVRPGPEASAVTIWKSGDNGNWNDANYFVFEVFGNNDYSGVITLELYKETTRTSEKIVLQDGEVAETEKESPWLSCLLGINPRLKTKVVFPLSYLDAQEIFIPRSPRQLKGTITGNRLDPEDIVKVNLKFGPYSSPYFTPEYEIASIGLMDSIPDPFEPLSAPIIDSLGQRIGKEWKGKISNGRDLVSLNLELEKAVAGSGFNSSFSKYGGCKEKRFVPTGFFRTQHDGKRWWLVDPEGYAFLSVGVDCMRSTSSGPVTGIEDLFEWLPEKKDLIFGESVSGNEKSKVVDFYKANLIRIFGSDWKSRWNKMTADMLRSLSINTVGNWSEISFAKENKLAYVLPLSRFPGTKIQLYRDFPDVFSDEYKKNSEEFARQLNDYKDDPYLIGYFLRNEPQWAFGYHNLAYEMFATDQPSATKDEFIKWINSRYNNDIQAFNKSWNLNFGKFDELRNITFKKYPSTAADSDFYSFSSIMVRKYVDIPCDEVVKVDKHHLNLGMRYAWISSDLLYRAGERFDVFSINGYGYAPPPTADIARISNKPVMIGEFHHGAVDRALPATGITGVISQDERGLAYRNYIEQGFSRPELIGMHYFQWVDQPYYGRFDGENYNIGIVTIQNLPYPELTQAMRITNERIYKVGSGSEEPFKAEIKKIPPIHY
ncbi:MAG TPA: hypothetical protein DEO60_12960 [Bacteroidales bacterium]|jgi:hypothetical protein|nr:hypothetical protein [Bacteroidales bacterium]